VPYTIEIDSISNDTVYVIDRKDILNFPKIQSKIELSDGKIKASNTSKLDPNFYSFKVDYKENCIIAFTHYSPANIFRNKWLIDQQAEMYESCISIKKSIDCLYYKININETNGEPEFHEKLIIFKNKKQKFESIFDYKDDYAAKALLTIKQIKEKKLLSNIDIFNKFCTNDEFMIKKLAKIYQENKIEAVHKNFKSLITANNAFKDKLNVNIDEKNNLILIPDDCNKDYIKSVLCLLNAETHENMITKAKCLFADAIQQKLSLG